MAFQFVQKGRLGERLLVSVGLGLRIGLMLTYIHVIQERLNVVLLRITIVIVTTLEHSYQVHALLSFVSLSKKLMRGIIFRNCFVVITSDPFCFPKRRTMSLGFEFNRSWTVVNTLT